jgi:hypothetical protein
MPDTGPSRNDRSIAMELVKTNGGEHAEMS